jgi:hypothetical protein
MKYNIVALDPSLISTALVVSSGVTFKMYNINFDKITGCCCKRIKIK